MAHGKTFLTTQRTVSGVGELCPSRVCEICECTEIPPPRSPILPPLCSRFLSPGGAGVGACYPLPPPLFPLHPKCPPSPLSWWRSSSV